MHGDAHQDKIRDKLRVLRKRDVGGQEVLLEIESPNAETTKESSLATRTVEVNGSTANDERGVNGSDDGLHETASVNESNPVFGASISEDDGNDRIVTEPHESLPSLDIGGLYQFSDSESVAKSTTRSATTKSTDLSGKWDLVVSEDFKTEYDTYLKLLGQPSLVRSVALSIIGMTTEETVQTDDGKELRIRGRNVRGKWERTLTASSADKPMLTPLVTADNETVQAECWWEGNGSIHRSWLRGVEKYGGGNFESKRYLEDEDQILVCESTFHPLDSSREKAHVVWRFRRADSDPKRRQG